MKTNKWISLIVNSVFAGICIAFAALLYLYAMTFTTSISAVERAVYGLLFGFGLFFIIVMEYKLFTGMVAGLVDMNPKDYVQLAVCYLFNTVGVALIGLMLWAIQNGMSKAVIDKAVAVTESKLSNSLLGSFFSSVFCGIMITFAVKSHKNAAQKSLSGTLGIIFPVLLFVFMGFEHCIANQAYICLAIIGGAKIEVGRLLLFMLITALGNIVGGIAFPLLGKLT